jgi:hypothetical protein
MQYLENLEHNSTLEEINNRYYLRSDVIDVSDYNNKVLNLWPRRHIKKTSEVVIGPFWQGFGCA